MDLLGRSTKPQAVRPPNIVVHVPLDQPSVNFNFAALAEAKYGWDALHPIAARIRAINRYESDEESDSEAAAPENAQTGTNGAVNGQHAVENDNASADGQPQKKKRKRRRDLEYYDISDPFIDDDELELQERTAASKDGFFVFQGPLVAEGETVRIEKADGTQKRTAGKGSRGGKVKRSNRASLGTATTAQSTARASSKSKAAENKSDDDSSVIVVSATKSAPAKKDSITKEFLAPAAVVSATEKTASVSVDGEANSISAQRDEKASLVEPLADRMEIDQNVPATSLPASTTPTASASAWASTSTIIPNGQAAPVEQLKRTPKPKLVYEPSLPSPASKLGYPTPKVYKKRQPSAATLAKRAEQAAALAAAQATPNPAASPSANAQETPSKSESPGAKTIFSTESLKRPRKPVREKTVEEKAELARKAREARERKKQEKQKLDDAILLRAFANPAIDTTGLSLPQSLASSPAPSTVTTSVDPLSKYDPNVFSTSSQAPHSTQVVKSPDTPVAAPKPASTPSHRSMDLGAVMD